MSTTNPLDTILEPRSIVFAGASPDPRKMGTLTALSLLSGGFSGEVAFIHPTARSVLGRVAYPAAADLPFVPDLAVVVTPAPVSAPILEELGERGTRHAVIVTGGFDEVGEEGRALGRSLRDAAGRHGIRFVGPNCVGVINSHAAMNLTVAPIVTPPGPLALASQSGTLVAQTHFLLRSRGVRLGKAVSVGNAYDIDLVDCLEHFAADPRIRAIALYVEGISGGERFVRVAKEVTRHKPVVALYIGGTESGARAGRSHTASLGGHDRVYDGLFEQAGVLRASTVDELFAWGWALASAPLPRGRRVAILTHSGGPAASMADECDRLGLEVPVLSPALREQIRPHVPPTGSVQNPVDLTFTLDGEGFARRLPEILFRSDEVDAVLIHGLMDSGFVRATAHSMARFFAVNPEEVVARRLLDPADLVRLPWETGKPLLGSTFVWDDHVTGELLAAGVPLTTSPQEAARALGALVRARDVQARPPVRGAAPPASIELPDSQGVLDEHASKRILAALGAPVPDERLCATLEEAVAAAEPIGYPLAVKGMAPGVAHKTEAGLVHLRVSTPAGLRAAWEAIEAVAPGCPRLLAPMLDGVRELAVGLIRVDGLGAAVMLGQGGILTEAIDDATFRLVPLAREDALAMPDSLKGRALFGAVRGMPPVDRDALADLLLAVARLAACPEVREVDVNPVIVVEGRPLVADAMIVLGSGKRIER